MKYLLNVVNPENSFTQKLSDLFAKHPAVDQNALGMKPEWHKEELWLVQ
jgi:hypothetical protein